jgi:hypothetical protein
MNNFDLDVCKVPREDLPVLAGRLAELSARVTLRLLETNATPTPEPPRILLPEEAAAMASVAPRWLLITTKGMPFRCDLSKKFPRFREDLFRQWLERRKR